MSSGTSPTPYEEMCSAFSDHVDWQIEHQKRIVPFAERLVSGIPSHFACPRDAVRWLPPAPPGEEVDTRESLAEMVNRNYSLSEVIRVEDDGRTRFAFGIRVIATVNGDQRAQWTKYDILLRDRMSSITVTIAPGGESTEVRTDGSVDFGEFYESLRQIIVDDWRTMRDRFLTGRTGRIGF